MSSVQDQGRHVGLGGATLVGLGAIVGGGIFVLAGVAFSAAGPGAILAFILNGVIAGLTALSFAEMASAHPESGGAYSFGKRVLSVRAAFAIGWILWFASIVAVLLYAFGFGAYAVELINGVCGLFGTVPPIWMRGHGMARVLAAMAIAAYSGLLIYRTMGGGRWSTIGKLAVFAVLIGAGSLSMVQMEESPERQLTPYLPLGMVGVLAAMGYTFIASQGFDIVAAIAGEVRDPVRTLPRAMLFSLAISMLVYIPLLVVICVAGTPPDVGILEFSNANPDTVMVRAAHNMMGPMGYWLVIIAAILSTLSALTANLLAASRVALAMARDRTLPRWLGRIHADHHTPSNAVLATSVIGMLLLLVVSNLAAAGSAASLIFLVSFALANGTCILARMRGGGTGFRTPLFPLVPLVGGLACIGLTIFQAAVEPAAGAITGTWLLIGALVYVLWLSRRAEAVDAVAEARDPQLLQMRGRRPLVLVPMANPATAAALVEVAAALAPPRVGRVLMLSVVIVPASAPREIDTEVLDRSTGVVNRALSSSIARGLAPEVLVTLAHDPWLEICRVARVHACESLLLGISSLTDLDRARYLEYVLGQVDCDAAVLSSPPGWRLEDVENVLVPVGGRGANDILRARLLGTLTHSGVRSVELLSVLPTTADSTAVAIARQELEWIAEEEALGAATCAVVQSDDSPGVIGARAAESDLVVLGLQRLTRRQKTFGSVALGVAQRARGATIMVSRRG